eukprot:Awhi_evm1s14050
MVCILQSKPCCSSGPNIGVGMDLQQRAALIVKCFPTLISWELEKDFVLSLDGNPDVLEKEVLNDKNVGQVKYSRHVLPTLDAGAEANNELCTSIPVPAYTPESGKQRDLDGAEGLIHVHRGIHVEFKRLFVIVVAKTGLDKG